MSHLVKTWQIGYDVGYKKGLSESLKILKEAHRLCVSFLPKNYLYEEIKKLEKYKK